ncbi:peroxide stress protein YaaA [Helicobacter macacae]|uniref:Peroxide stress protein YaaA n=1 Tax=Helicobacter macacae MIT 99-5501 TaxID=1357400 RepID=V8C677_9HELI|nr:peroxide stress protein YaaA [Helicobacter macacae]ETD22562.1 hypothetical protein HMPREF2086_01878 [Helicobacter macacae MIT 99-5501]
MQILFSPSEAKLSPKEITNASTTKRSILEDALWGGQVARNANISAYLDALQKSSELIKIFGTKRVDMDMLSACLELANAPRIEALKLYSGVAYKALDFASLEKKAQDFLLESTLIFSNLFGLVRGFDPLPYYHLNQNYRSKNLSLNALYKAQRDEISAFLDKIIIDLRAGVYAKAYPLKSANFCQPHYILPIPKGTSHQAKLYRGLALRELAIASLQGKQALQKILSEKFVYVD